MLKAVLFDYGKTLVEFDYPDNLTAWQINAESIADGNRFGSAQTSTHTFLPLQARLRMPRALVAPGSDDKVATH